MAKKKAKRPVKTKKAAKKKAKPRKKAKAASRSKPCPREKLIGKVEHVFEKIHVITTTLKNPLKVGDIIHIKGHTTDFLQPVDSLQIEHETVQKAARGDGIGIKVNNVVRDTDIIYLADKKTAMSYKTPVGAHRDAPVAKSPTPIPIIPQVRQQTSFAFNPASPQPEKMIQKPEQPKEQGPPKFLNF